MCTRYIAPDQAALERAWHIGRHNQPKWAENVFPRARGPFLRPNAVGTLELVVGRWGLIPGWAKTPELKFATMNCRSEEAARKPAFRDAWRQEQRCIIPAWSFDEPCWETGRNVWWRFRRADGCLWGLAGLWSSWIDRATGEVLESYTMLTCNADGHPLMGRMHKPDPHLPSDRQDKRSVVAIEIDDLDRWFHGSCQDVLPLLCPPEPDRLVGEPL